MSEATPTVRRKRRTPACPAFDRRTLLVSAAVHGAAAALFLWLAPPGTLAPPLRQLTLSAETRPALEADSGPLDAKPPEPEAPRESPLLEEALTEEAPDPRLAALPDPSPDPPGGPAAGWVTRDSLTIGLGSGRVRPGRWARGVAPAALGARVPEEAPPPDSPAFDPPPVDEPAMLVDYSAPPYPEQARARGLEGVVRLRVEVLADGTIGEVEVLESSGSDLLDRAAIEAVRKWGFRPAVAADRPVRSLLTLPKVRFSLR